MIAADLPVYHQEPKRKKLKDCMIHEAIHKIAMPLFDFQQQQPSASSPSSATNSRRHSTKGRVVLDLLVLLLTKPEALVLPQEVD